MKKNSLQWLVGAVLMGLFLLGCSERMTEPQATESGPPIPKGLSSLGKKEVNPEAVNDALEKLAVALARALTEKDMRIKLKEEVGKKFDGDYNTLFKHLADHRFANGPTFRQKLARGYAQARAAIGERMDDAVALVAVNALAGRIPKFHIAVPVNYDRWDANDYVPLVAYHPVGIDDILVEKVKAFDAEGRLLWLDARVPPAQPVIVLAINERTDDDGNVRIMALPIDDGDGGGWGGGGGGTSLPPRSSGILEILEQLQVLNDHEPWTKGDAEVCLKIQVENRPNSDITHIYWITWPGAGTPWGDDYTGWRCTGLSLFNWYRDAANNNDYGDFAVYFWYEDDTDWGSLTFDVNVLGKQFKFTYNGNDIESDDLMGHNIVNFADPYRMYQTGSINWYDRW